MAIRLFLKKMISCGALTALALYAASCQREVTTPIRVEVRTNQGDPVHEAQVKIGSRVLGVTDAKGFLDVKPSLPEGSQLSIEVSKSSDSYYFAPHVETLDLQKTKSRPVVVKAVLYFVPKPKPVEAASTEAQPSASPDAKQTGTASTPANLPASPEPEAANASVTAVAGVTDAVAGVAPEGAAKTGPESAKNELEPEDKPVKPAAAPAKVLVTFHVFSGNNGLAGVTISGIPADGVDVEGNVGNDSTLCTTNVRGRCAVKIDAGTSLTLKAAKPGYMEESQDLRVDSSNKLVRIQLEKGQHLSVSAFARGALWTSPLQGVVVSIDGKPVGSTDKSGRFLYTFKGSSSSRNGPLMKVEMAPPAGFLPETAESEFAPVAGIHLVRHFAGGMSKVPVVILEESRLGSSSLDAPGAAALAKASDSAFERNIFPRKVLARATKGQKHPDVRIRRSFSKKDSAIHAELVAVDAKGIVMAASKQVIPAELAAPGQAANLQKVMDTLVDRLVRSLPFQGVVVDAAKGQVRALLPGQLAAVLRPGDRFDVFSTRYDPRARKQTFSNVASAKVAQPASTAATGENAADRQGGELGLVIEGTPSGKPVARGDIIVLRGALVEAVVEAVVEQAGEPVVAAPETKVTRPATSKPAGNGASVLVSNKSSDDPRPVQQANVYVNDVWVGTTNNNGVVYLPKQIIGAKGKISVAKAGWNPVEVDAQAINGRQVEVALEPEASRLRVDSVPSGASVFLDGKLAGKTPLETKLDGAGAFIKMEIAGPEGFKKYSSVLEVEAGTLDLTGQRSVQLEDDVVTGARRLSDGGKAAEAIAALEKVPAGHSDYLVSRHVAGEIALAKLNDPVKAEQFFSVVTAAPEVRDFIDKRFVGSHINQGIALHMIAEKMSRSNPKAAADNFAKAAVILDRAARYTRFLPKKDFKTSVQNLEYFRALSFHRRWLLVNDPVALENANRGWRDYVGGVTTGDESDKQAKVLADNARVYLKQTEAGMSRR
jgi:hypothetical protein